MTGEVELVSDGDGVFITGDQHAVRGFLAHVGLAEQAREFDMTDSAVLRGAARMWPRQCPA